MKWGIEYELGHVAAAKLGIGQAKMSAKLEIEEMVREVQTEAIRLGMIKERESPLTAAIMTMTVVMTSCFTMTISTR